MKLIMRGPVNFAGQEVVYMGNMSDMSGTDWYDFTDRPEKPNDISEEDWGKHEDDSLRDIREKFFESLNKNKNEIFEWSIG
jgi:hypothetical protein